MKGSIEASSQPVLVVVSHKFMGRYDLSRVYLNTEKVSRKARVFLVEIVRDWTNAKNIQVNSVLLAFLGKVILLRRRES
jgi:hypothetical protein